MVSWWFVGGVVVVCRSCLGVLLVSWLFLCGLWVVIRSCLGGVSVVSLVSRWFLGGDSFVSRWFLDGFLVVSRWYLMNTTPSTQHHKHHHQHNTLLPTQRFGEVRPIEYYGRPLRLRGRRSTWSTSVSFCVAGAARGAPPREVRGNPARIE